ncbi:MAG: DUF2863 family protein, partial [Zoogloeaceae bacterium]|nr:DUF2863 family protein [Zoogloeaceae bacterium]
MKRSRFGARDRISRDAAELQRLAIGQSESGSMLEDRFWHSRLAGLTRDLLRSGAEDELTTTMDRLYESHPLAYDELIGVVEAQAESCELTIGEARYDVLLFAAPILAWSRYAIPTCRLGANNLNTLKVQLSAHVFGAHARLALLDYLFSPDQLPRNFCDVRELTESLGTAALAANDMAMDTDNLPETSRSLSDLRYLIGAVAVPQGDPVFRWNEADGSREAARAAWNKQGGSSLAPLFTGCAWQPLLADAYHHACRQGDMEFRAYGVKAAVAFLQTTLGLLPGELRAVIAPCYDQRLEEYRVSFAPRGHDHQVYLGVVWVLLGAEDENSEITSQIDTLLRECGLSDIVILDTHMPM